MEARGLSSIKAGESRCLDFVITERQMEDFRCLSGDSSYIHTNDEYCRAKGFRSRVVYGGVILAKLSGVLGTLVPGAHGLSAQWTVKFRKPLYIGVPARVVAEVVEVSLATRLVLLTFTVEADGLRVASGSVHTLVLDSNDEPHRQ